MASSKEQFTSYGASADHLIRSQFSVSGDSGEVQSPFIEVVDDGGQELVAKYNDPANAHLSGFEKLKKYHPIPPPLATYDASSPLVTLFRYSGTGLQLALKCVDFWLLLAIHVLLSVTYFYLGYPVEGGTPTAPGWPKVNLNLIAIPGGLTTFVLVFYLNQAFSRYVLQSSRCTGTVGALGEFVMLLRIHMGDHVFSTAHQVRTQLWKFSNAIHILAITMHPSYREDKIDIWGWWFLKDNNLLTDDQIKELKPLVYRVAGGGAEADADGRLAFREVVMWTTKGVWAQQAKGRIDSKVAALFTYKLWEIRNFLEELYTFPSGPVPFAYYHLLNFVLIIYLLFLSYAFVFVSPLWSLPGFVLILIGLLGTRELANAMSNPLGDDVTDIPVFHNIQGTLSQSKLLVERSTFYDQEPEVLKPKVASAE